MMRRIQKTISLEPMTSRLPSIIPSYKDGVAYYFDDKSLKEREYAYPSNYGMVPMNIRISGETMSFDGIGFSATTDWSKVSIVSLSSDDACHVYGKQDNWDDLDCYGMPTNPIEPYDELCDTEYVTLSFERIQKMIGFFREYYNLLNKYGHCERSYASAVDYYNYESLTKYADEMVYGVDKAVYEDLDARFLEYGGVVELGYYTKPTKSNKKDKYELKYGTYEDVMKEARENDKDDSVTIVEARDNGFFKWLKDNVVLSFSVPKEYGDYWKTDELYYPDVIRWMAWLESRSEYEETAEYEEDKNDGNTEHWNCKAENVTDCCECEEYFRRGGARMLGLMKEWYAKAQSKIDEVNEVYRGNEDVFMPTAIMPIELQNTLDESGQESILSSEFELMTDYRTANGYDATENTEGGTVVSVDGNPMILVSGSGSKFDGKFMEGSFDEDAWEDYTSKYMNEECNKEKFKASGYKKYAVGPDGKLYFGSTDDDIIEQIEDAATYPIVNKDAILVNGSMIDIEKSEYGHYDAFNEKNEYEKGRLVLVMREEETQTPYAVIDGRKVYASFYQQEGIYYFTFIKADGYVNKKATSCGTTPTEFNIEDYKKFPRKADYGADGTTVGEGVENASTGKEMASTELLRYFTYNGVMYEVGDDDYEVSIDYVKYPRIEGYAVDLNGEEMYILKDDGRIVRDDMTTVDKAEVVDDTIVIRLNEVDKGSLKIFNVNELTGITTSKLQSLELKNRLVDDIGNYIDGIYNVQDADTSGASDSTPINPQPPQGTVLELLYQVGNTANVVRYKNTVEEIDLLEEEDGALSNYFVGDIISAMTFYYVDTNGNKVDDTVVSSYISDEKDKETTVKWGEDGEDTSIKRFSTSLFCIGKATKAKERIEQEQMEDGYDGEFIVFDDDIRCDVVYYLGATLVRRGDGTSQDGKYFNMPKDPSKYTRGVRYEETVKFAKKHREYCLKVRYRGQIPSTENSASAHTVSYPIWVYELVQDKELVSSDTYGTSYEDAKATFSTEINLYNDDGGKLSPTYEGNDMSKDVKVFPMYKEEYLIGASSLENIDTDIYIERGANAAFERHLKLQEVRSLDDLLKYGNGFFTTMDN